MNSSINQINNWKRNLVPLLAIPIIILGFTYISYGNIFDKILSQQIISSRFFQLNTQLLIFKNEYDVIILDNLPLTVLKIGHYSVLLTYILFFFWILVYTISTYAYLAFRKGMKFLMLLELMAILAIFIYSVNPGLDMWISIAIYSIISVNFLILLAYFLYDLKSIR